MSVTTNDLIKSAMKEEIDQKMSSFDKDKIYENASCVINAINEAKPATVKGKFLVSLCISTSMNPGLALEF